eukprot:GHVN01027331.1.p1 GENE.GHVN01027331.1~~GHVN01027331.1.p1  ORF type:complete len:114 (+),score=39.34 GHVN01027331.1:204-545(+)
MLGYSNNTEDGTQTREHTASHGKNRVEVADSPFLSNFHGVFFFASLIFTSFTHPHLFQSSPPLSLSTISLTQHHFTLNAPPPHSLLAAYITPPTSLTRFLIINGGLKDVRPQT